MLKTLKKSPFINLNIAHLKEQNNFPILEVFITSYLTELSKLLGTDLRGDYILIEDNVQYLKGKILLKDHIKYNSINKTRFFCQFDEFNTNISPNKLIKATLLRLFTISSSSFNKKKIIKSLQFFEMIDIPSDLDSDIRYCIEREKFLNNYGNLIKWSEIFLKNKSFTNFHGNSINQAILFPMEKLFESYIAYLIKKQCKGITLESQDKRYCLVNQKADRNDINYTQKRFPLKPDLVINNNEVILDTKWKIIDSFTKKFDIKEADIYQMHAYGRRYQEERIAKTAPRLALIYPLNKDFKNSLNQFRFGNDLLLDVIPFDFSKQDHGKHIEDDIIKLLFKNTIKSSLYKQNDNNLLSQAAEEENNYG